MNRRTSPGYSTIVPPVKDLLCRTGLVHAQLHQSAWTGRTAASPGPERARLRRSITAVTTTAARVTPSMIVARALTAGVRPKRTAEYSTIGQVLVVPFVNAGST